MWHVCGGQGKPNYNEKGNRFGGENIGSTVYVTIEPITNFPRDKIEKKECKAIKAV